MCKLLLALGFLVSLQAHGAEYQVPRRGVQTVLRSTGYTCQTFAESMQNEHLVCVDNIWHYRLFRVTYEFQGASRTVEMSYVPKARFRVNEAGEVIDPDRTMHGHY